MTHGLPGSCGYPVIGETSLEFYRDPVSFVQRRNEQHGTKVFQVRFLNTPTAFVSCPLMIKQLLTSDTQADFNHGYRALLHKLYGDSVLFENGAEAMKLRSCLQPLFKSTSLYKENIERVMDPFIKDLANKKNAVSVYQEIKDVMTRLCLKLFLGVDRDASDGAVANTISELATKHWHGIISVPINLRIPFGTQSTYSQAFEAKKELLCCVRRIISSSSKGNSQNKDSTQRCRGENSALDCMREMDFPTETDMEQHLLLFVSALIPKAFASILTSFLIEMAGDDKHAWRERARTNDEFLENVLLEVQRLWPPFFGGRRLAANTTSLDKYKIPKDHAVVYVSHLAHRDPRVFPNPELFDPDRWTSKNANDKDLIFCFGAGPRCCIGRVFIREILLDVARRLLRDYDWDLSSDSQKVTYKFLPVARPVELPLVTFRRVR